MNCETCGKPLPVTGRGRPRRFCDDSCRKAPRVLTLPTGELGMGKAAERVGAEARARRTLDATDEAILAALLAVGAALDTQPANAALHLQWRGLLHDLQLSAPGQVDRDMAEILSDFRLKLHPGGAA